MVTGASTGIGEAFARRLGREGYDLIAVANRGEEELLNKVCTEVGTAYGVRACCIAADFRNHDDVAAVADKIKQTPNLEILVNNAGFGDPGVFHRKDAGIMLDILRVNIMAAVRLTHAVLPGMIERAKKIPGLYAIINLSSVAAFSLYTPNLVYRSSKVFLKAFSDSLAFELRGTGVRVQALCPGMTRTAMFSRLGYKPDHPIYKKYKFMEPEEVADASLRCLRRNRVVCIPGVHNKLLAFLFSVMPRRLFGLFYNMFRKSRGRYVRGLGQ